MAAEDLKHYLMELELQRVDLVTAGANPGAHVLIHKFDAPDTLEVEVAEQTVETPEVQKQETTPVAQDVETVAKAEFDAVQKQLAELNKALEDARVAREADAERIAKMERERRQGEFIAKAKDLANIGAADALGNLLLEVSEGVSADAFKSLEQLLKAANAQLEKGALFATFGQAGADNEPKSLEERINELAKAKVEAGSAKTIEIAKLAVLNENPGLRAEYGANRS